MSDEARALAWLDKRDKLFANPRWWHILTAVLAVIFAAFGFWQQQIFYVLMAALISGLFVEALGTIVFPRAHLQAQIDTLKKVSTDLQEQVTILATAVSDLETTKELITKEARISQLAQRLTELDPHADLLKDHGDLEKNLQRTFAKMLQHVADRVHANGLTIVEAGDEDYLGLLADACHDATGSLLAVLSYEYSPWWFFPSSTEPPKYKLEYLHTTARATNIQAKIRLLIYDWDAEWDEDDGRPSETFASRFAARIEDVRRFLKVAGDGEDEDGTQHWLLNWPTYREASDSFPKLALCIKRILADQDDFAMLDQRLVIKKRKGNVMHLIAQPSEKYYIHLLEQFEITKNQGLWIRLNTHRCENTGWITSTVEQT